MDRACGDVDESEESEMNKKTCSEISTVLEESEDSPISSDQITDLQKYRINDPAYLVFRTPKYTLPPHQDPKLAPLNLRDQVKVICSYHASISRSMANLAKLQIDSCNYPAPIPPERSDTFISKDVIASEESKGGSNANCEEYISRSGRITKRKFYLEADIIDMNKGSSQGISESTLQEEFFSSKGNSDDESYPKKKGTPASSKTRNLRPKQLKLDASEEEMESKKKCSTKNSSCTVTRQKRSTDGFVKPSNPGSNKKPIKKTVQCPICCIDFPEKEVEQHASSCGDSSAGIEGLMDTPSNNTGFRCHSCKKMMVSLEAYENHRTICNGGPSYLS